MARIHAPRWLAVLLLGMLALPLRAAAPSYFLVEEIASGSEQRDLRAQAQELARIYAALSEVAGVDAKLVYSTDPDINAFATEVGEERIVVVQEGLLAAFGGDRDAVAATLGHELAHHKADHIRAGRRKQEGVRVFGAILGAVVGAKVGRSSGQAAGALSGAAVGVGANLLALKFSRNQELEADRLALAWMLQAGFNPNGMLRLQEHLQALQGTRRAAIFSTHPTSRKRLRAAEQTLTALAPPTDLLAQPSRPLADVAALTHAEAEIGARREAAMRVALQPEGPPPADGIAPVEGVTLTEFAAISNALVHAGRGGQDAVYARFAIDAARHERVQAGFIARMRAEPALAQRYGIEYHRASQGTLAAWGRDLAQSQELGRPLELEPPFAIETARALRAQIAAHFRSDGAGERIDALERNLRETHRVGYYDAMLGLSWWTRYATIAAARGDSGVLLALHEASDEEAAKAANVHVGKNVKVGKNVRFGSASESNDD